MLLRSDKSKQFLFSAVKILIIGLAFYFIDMRLAGNDWYFFSEKLSANFTWFSAGLLLIMAFYNRYFEILKWQNLVSSFKPISIADSTKQVLGAFTASIFTPNGIGEYGAKAMFFESKYARKVVFLNLLCNGVQMVITVIFGVAGLLYFNLHHNIVSTKIIFIILIVVGILLILAFMLRTFKVKGYSFQRVMEKIRGFPKKIHRKNLLLALARYIIFSHQYYFILLIFNVELSYLMAMATICSVYFLSSSLPTFQFLDFAVKGSVAVYFFGLLGINEWIPIFAATLIWILNVVLPVAIGSYYVITFKPAWKQ
ncbi:MAG: hypothetical protein EOO48_06485 [Flavobacterium sp.]|nr:MAG: hypothetical protein EOO48_06485 [Flavobacterium sp.]